MIKGHKQLISLFVFFLFLGILLGNKVSGTEYDLWSWGRNSYGQLGDGSVVTQIEPVQILTSDIQAVAGGNFYSQILKTDGSLWACGYNLYGQLGDGSTTDRHTPVQILASGVQSVETGFFHTMIVKTDGSLWACGRNYYGQLGDGSATDRHTPVQILASGVKEVAAGQWHTMIVKTDGSLWACGRNHYGQLGDGSTSDSTSPKMIMASGVQSVAAGQAHTMILKADGSLWACGYNASGQLGDGTAYDSYNPIQIIASGVQSVAAGLFHHTMIIKTDGSLWACGENDYGQLGNGNNMDQHSPVQIFSSGVQSAAVGYYHTQILKTDGSLWACGKNGYGQLGNGSFVDSNSPVQIICSGIHSVAAGGYHTLGMRAYYSICGTVNGDVKSGVTVTLSGVTNSSTTTDADGNYYFTGLPDGEYTVTPSLTGYTFSPFNYSVTVSGSDETGKDFTSTASSGGTYSISGTVSGDTKAGVTLTLSTAVNSTTTTTGTEGSYSFTGLANGVYTITPSKTGYTFNPSSLNVTVSNADVSSQNFTATVGGVITYSISGKVSGDIIAGVQLTLSGTASGETTSGTDGSYSFSGLSNGDYIVTPSFTGYTFGPTNHSVTIAGSDVTGKDFVSVIHGTTTYMVGGTVSGDIKEGVTLKLKNTETSAMTRLDTSTTSNSEGEFYFTGIEAGNYTITPSLTGYTFNPSSREVTVSSADVTGQDFTSLTSNGSGIIIVVTPNGSESNAAGGTTTIKWASANVTGNLRIELLKGGVYNLTIASDTENVGAYEWTIPANQPLGSDYKVKISSVNNPSVNDTSDGDFEITEPVSGEVTLTMRLFPEKGGVTEPSADEDGETAVNVGESFSISATPYYGFNFVAWLSSSNVVIDDSTIASTTATLYGDGSIKAVFDSGSGGGMMIVTYPNGGEALVAGSEVNIQWASFNFEGTVKIELYKNEILDSIITPGTENNGEYSWTVPENQIVGNDYRLKISSVDPPSKSDPSDADFSIIAATEVKMTMSSIPSDVGTLDPGGDTTVGAGLPVSITATPPAGMKFVRWKAKRDENGKINATFDDYTLSSTRVTLIQDTTIYALFSMENGGKTSDLIGFEKVIFKINGSKDNSDAVLIHDAEIPLSFSYAYIDPADFEIQVMIDDYSLTMTEETGTMSTKGNFDVFQYKADKNETAALLTLNFNNSGSGPVQTWSLKINKIDLSELVNNDDGVDIFILIGDQMFGDNLDMDEVTRWKFKKTDDNTSEISVMGSPMDNFDIDSVNGRKMNAFGDSDSFCVKKGSLDTVEDFDPATDNVAIYLDDWEDILDSDEFTQSGDKNIWKFNGKTATEDAPCSLILDFEKNLWKFKISKVDFFNQINGSDGIDVRLEVGAYEGGLRIFADELTQLKYFSKDEGEEPENPTYAISGEISGDVIDGVTLTLSQSKGRGMYRDDTDTETTSDVNGKYRFNDLADGTYTVTPGLTGYIFKPESKEIRLSGKNVNKVSFSCTPGGAEPKVTTSEASSVTSSSVVLNGTVNPNGLAAKYYFEYGVDLNYGSQTAETDIGSGLVNVDASAALADLNANTTYHFRLIGVNTTGTTYGYDKTFTTTDEDTSGKYLTVDLSTGSVSQADTAPSDLLTNEEYKTTKIVLRKISAGTFSMGSPADEIGRLSNETQHQVTLTKDFYMGVFEVTQKQYETVFGINPSTYPGEKHPVETIRWSTVRGGTWPGGEPDSSSFMGKLRVLAGGTYKFDLPTEARWEYTCRAGTTGAYHNDTDCQLAGEGQDTNLDGLAWYDYNASEESIQHQEVGTRQANDWGLYDMSGNVWEWCLDWYQWDLGTGEVTDPDGSSSGSNRVLRGGGWDSYARSCRSANRYGNCPCLAHNNLGFRICLPVEE